MLSGDGLIRNKWRAFMDNNPRALLDKLKGYLGGVGADDVALTDERAMSIILQSHKHLREYRLRASNHIAEERKAARRFGYDQGRQQIKNAFFIVEDLRKLTLAELAELIREEE
jgi:hypothetical protein